MPDPAPLDALLPINRRDRFWSATVLPGVIGGDDLAGLPRLLALAGPEVQTGPPGDRGALLLTEYGVAGRDGRVSQRLPEVPWEGPVPPVLVLVQRPAPVLLALEPSLFARPSAAQLALRVWRRAKVLEPLAARLSEDLGARVAVEVRLLLPAHVADGLELVEHVAPPLTWEQLLAAYADGGETYWSQMLAAGLAEARTAHAAIDADPEDPSLRGPEDGHVLTGEQIVEGARAHSMPWHWMARAHGLSGAPLASDLESGMWTSIEYQVAVESPDADESGAMWFRIEDFLVRAAERADAAYDEDPRTRFAQVLTHVAVASEKSFGGGSLGEQVLLAERAGLLSATTGDVIEICEKLEAVAQATRDAYVALRRMGGEIEDLRR